MNILFITLCTFTNIDKNDLYEDLMRCLAMRGHAVYIVSPIERRYNVNTKYVEFNNQNDWHKNVHILTVKSGNIQKTNILEKGISTIKLESILLNGIKKYFKNVKFDLITYSTPPITIVKPVSFIKKRDNAKTFLMLKDIFPQNAVDLGMMKTTGLKGILYKYFRKKEKKLYSISDKIGCMSQANVEYVLNHNPEISKDKVEIFPNCIEPVDVSLTDEEKKVMREKYGIPTDKKIFVYGGNLGKPQGVPFIIDCLKAEKNNKDVFFLIVGDGTEYGKLEQFENEEHPSNFKLMKKLPKDDYDRMIASCDVGMIFLDYRFTIPNFPSRVLSLMQAGLPVLACTDPNTDIGEVVENNGFGFKCLSDNSDEFIDVVKKFISRDNKKLGEVAFEFLKNNYNSNNCYEQIKRFMEEQ